MTRSVPGLPEKTCSQKVPNWAANGEISYAPSPTLARLTSTVASGDSHTCQPSPTAGTGTSWSFRSNSTITGTAWCSAHGQLKRNNEQDICSAVVAASAYRLLYFPCN